MTTITTKAIQSIREQGFEVLSRRQWGSQYPEVYAWRREHRPAHQPADTVFQHITVTLDHGPLTGDFKRDVRTVEKIGYDLWGTGISYNWVVDMKTGMIAAGMPLDAKGSHTVNRKGVHGFSYDQNYMARGIAVLGMPQDKLSRRGSHAITAILVGMARVGAITRTPDYEPHSLVAAKDCPCDSTRNRMDDIYRRFQEAL